MSRTMVSPTLVGSALALAAASAAPGQTPTFRPLPGTIGANDLTPDGRYVVGGLFAGGGYIFDRIEGTFTPIGGLDAVAVSDDASVVLGPIDDPGTGFDVAGIWDAVDGWQSLGGIAPTGCPNLSTPYELSADGSVAVGLGWDGCEAYGSRWSEATGMLPLELLANGVNRASVVSGDGQLIGGFAQGSFDRTPALWAADGTGQLLDPPNGDVVGEVHGISDSGVVVLGDGTAAPSGGPRPPA